MQTANDPRALPVGASAFCEVAAGVLFTGDNGHRLLLAVDWMPMNMLVVENAADIGTFNSECELVSMNTFCATGLRTPTARSPFVI